MDEELYHQVASFRGGGWCEWSTSPNGRKPSQPRGCEAARTRSSRCWKLRSKGRSRSLAPCAGTRSARAGRSSTEPCRARATRSPANPEGTRWGTRLFVLDEPPTLVGWGGFKGPPAGRSGRARLCDRPRPARPRPRRRRRPRAAAGGFSDGGVKAVHCAHAAGGRALYEGAREGRLRLRGRGDRRAGRPVWRWRHDRPLRDGRAHPPLPAMTSTRRSPRSSTPRPRHTVA